MIAIDTNLLVYAHRAHVPEHAAARHAIEEASDSAAGWGITHTAVTEFWSIVTHPRAAGRPSTVTDATAFIRALTDAGATLWSPGSDFCARLVQAASDLNVQGPRVFDLQIALTAFDNGAHEIWTHDRDFVTVAGLKVHDPLVG